MEWPAPLPGWKLEARGDVRPRGMAVSDGSRRKARPPRQNSAYRPTHPSSLFIDFLPFPTCVSGFSSIQLSSDWTGRSVGVSTLHVTRRQFRVRLRKPIGLTTQKDR